MFRLLMWLVAMVVAITFFRGIVGILGKAVGNHVGRSRMPQPPKPEAIPEPLRKCAECGLYATAYATAQNGGSERHYCSAACQERAEAAHR